jgi:hypothetical protein
MMRTNRHRQEEENCARLTGSRANEGHVLAIQSANLRADGRKGYRVHGANANEEGVSREAQHWLRRRRAKVFCAVGYAVGHTQPFLLLTNRNDLHFRNIFDCFNLMEDTFHLRFMERNNYRLGN